MSFVITTVSLQNVVQVSETRLSSLKDKRALAEDLCKSIIVQGTEAKFAVGWTGLATTVEGHNTRDWLFRVLLEMDAARLPIAKLMENLVGLATERFLSLTASDTRCHITLTGWDKLGPFAGYVSTYVLMNLADQIDEGPKHYIPPFSENRVAALVFQGGIQRFRNLSERHFLVGVMGDCDPAKLNTHFRGLKRLLKKRPRAATISGACKQIVWEAARHSKTIGTDVVALEMERCGESHLAFYSKEGADLMLFPDSITLHGGITCASLRPVLSEREITLKLRGKRLTPISS
jgi:hypothetical protein